MFHTNHAFEKVTHFECVHYPHKIFKLLGTPMKAHITKCRQVRYGDPASTYGEIAVSLPLQQDGDLPGLILQGICSLAFTLKVLWQP